jgi:Fe/S biogenesis protein NfuA
MDAPTTVLSVSEKALRRVLEIRSQEDDPTTLALWVEIMGVNGDEFAYDIYFQSPDEAGPNDVRTAHDDLVVIVPVDSIEQLTGATLDLSRDLLNPGLVMNNPNPPPAPAAPTGAPPGPPIELIGTPAERIVQVLEAQINPSIASHGGRADLAGFEDGTAYLRLSGGCQGCAQSTATLRNGIETSLRNAIPEITAIVDVTDHASGTNPYFEAAAH